MELAGRGSIGMLVAREDWDRDVCGGMAASVIIMEMLEYLIQYSAVERISPHLVRELGAAAGDHISDIRDSATYD